MNTIIPVLLAGGSGKRLWPVSRKSYPKQFTNILFDKTLFQQSALRLVSSDLISFTKHITITNSDFRFIVCEQFQKVGINPGSILIEPENKNTAPAILAAALHAHTKDKDAILLVSPSDHTISDIPAFHRTIISGLKEAKLGKFVTFGIRPTRPETGYGYISVSKLKKNSVMTVKKFIEKPDALTAQSIFNDGKHFWNSGIFLFRASDMIAAFETYAPENLKLTKYAIETAQSDFGFLKLNPKPWKKIKSISVDYAIMEKSKNLVVIECTSMWSDIGDWNAVWTELDKDQSGTALSEAAFAIECSNTLLRSESTKQPIVGIGLNNIIAIAMPDAVLVTQKNRAQDVKKAVDYLKINNVYQAEQSTKDNRPWGYFEILTINKLFQVKLIHIKPEASISLQSHMYRSEHWVVVEGEAKVTIDNEVKSIRAGQSVYIPKKIIHRLENEGKDKLVVIEVQFGSYLGEDDIIRYEDLYSR